MLERWIRMLLNCLGDHFFVLLSEIKITIFSQRKTQNFAEIPEPKILYHVIFIFK